ncbi:MAG: hypothetical protein ACK4RF_12060 [Cyclobacteriaceae bacterium]
MLTRKKFVWTSIGLTALIALTPFLRNKARLQPKKTVKFLTREGKLVEVDVDKLPGQRMNASREDIQNWIKP